MCGDRIDGIATTEKDVNRLGSIKLVNGPAIWYLTIDLVFADNTSENLFLKNVNDSLLSYIPKRR